MKLFFKIIRKIIISCFIIYIFNYFAVKYNFIIPINLYSVGTVTCFGIFGLFGMIIFKLFVL